MSDVTIFQQNAVPDYLREVGVSDLTKSLLSNAGGSGGNKRISLRGKKFRLVVDGEELSTLKSESIDVVIVNATKDISRTFYSKAYDPKAEASPPDCWSKDGTVPDPTANAPQATKCDACPQNIKGSGQGNSRACRYSKRLAIALADDLESGVYQLTLPSASIFGDGEKNQMPFNKYVKYVGTQGYSIDTLVTTMAFDEDSDSPRVYFNAVRFLTQDEHAVSSKLGKSQEAINAITMTVSQTDNGFSSPALAAPKASAPEVYEAGEIEVEAEPTVRKSTKSEDKPVSKPDLGDILSKFANVNTKVVDDE
jgi:hypothetical protein